MSFQKDHTSVVKFPAAMARALAAKASLTPHRLRMDYPWIIHHIAKHWGNPIEFVNSCNFLLQETCKGTFELPDQAIKEIIALKDYHLSLFPINEIEAQSDIADNQSFDPLPHLANYAPTWPWVTQMETAKILMEQPPQKSSHKLGEILISVGVLDQSKLQWALSFQSRIKTSRKRFTISEVLVASKAAQPEEVAAGLCIQRGGMLLDLESLPIDPLAERLLPRDLAIHFGVAAVAASERTLLIACPGPHCFEHTSEISRMTQRRIVLAHAPWQAILSRHKIPFN